MAEPLLQALDNDVFYSLKHPLQPRRFTLALFFALILFPLIAVALIAGTIVVIVPFIAFLLWLSGRVLFAHYMGNSILVSELNYPRINNLGEELKAKIGYKKPVDIFVFEQGNFNTSLMKFFFYRRAVFLNSELLEAGVTDDELRWLIGRFVGYLRARRQAGFWGWTIRAAQTLGVFNLFLLPYERALVYTGDRIALAMINGDVCSAVSAMQKLLVGRQLGYSVNPNGLLDQQRKVKGSLFAFLDRLGRAFPPTTARYVDLIEFAKERFQEQFQRFEAQNPGLPDDIRPLTALPGAVTPVHGKRDPVWGSVTGAALVVGLFAVLTAFVVVPVFRNALSKERASTAPVMADTSALPPAATPAAEAQPDTGASSAGPASASAPEPQPAASASSPRLSAAPEAQPLTVDTSSAAPAAQPVTSDASSAAFSSSEGHFSVAFPGSPNYAAEPLKLSETESATLHRFQFIGNGLIYIVTYNDFPSSMLAGSPTEILATVRDGALEGTPLLVDQVIDLNGVPGRAFAFQKKDGRMFVARDFLRGGRLYQVVVIADATSSPTQVAKFLNSFRIVGD